MIYIKQNGVLHDSDDMIRKFGATSLCKGIDCGLYSIDVPSNIREILRINGFKKCAYSNAISNMKKGKPIEYLIKASGRIKLKFSGMSLQEVLDHSDVCQSFMSRISLANMYEIACRKQNRGMMEKFEDVDVKIDPITCESIVDPVFIMDDLKAGCKVIYDRKTIEGFRKFDAFVYAWDIIDDEVREYQYFIPTNTFLSPYTRKVFTKDSIVNYVKYIK